MHCGCWSFPTFFTTALFVSWSTQNKVFSCTDSQLLLTSSCQQWINPLTDWFILVHALPGNQMHTFNMLLYIDWAIWNVFRKTFHRPHSYHTTWSANGKHGSTQKCDFQLSALRTEAVCSLQVTSDSTYMNTHRLSRLILVDIRTWNTPQERGRSLSREKIWVCIINIWKWKS